MIVYKINQKEYEHKLRQRQRRKEMSRQGERTKEEDKGLERGQ